MSSPAFNTNPSSPPTTAVQLTLHQNGKRAPSSIPTPPQFLLRPLPQHLSQLGILPPLASSRLLPHRREIRSIIFNHNIPRSSTIKGRIGPLFRPWSTKLHQRLDEFVKRRASSWTSGEVPIGISILSVSICKIKFWKRQGIVEMGSRTSSQYQDVSSPPKAPARHTVVQAPSHAEHLRASTARILSRWMRF